MNLFAGAGVAAEALGRLGDARALGALEKTCSADNCYVRIAAEEAITRLKDIHEGKGGEKIG
jgi:HEAT repeat protein